ncbi:MAG: PHP domain-containing protein [Lentisphaerae bacterium]|nr:PHP domain-containing protein [Lentisphaerota bacterium]
MVYYHKANKGMTAMSFSAPEINLHTHCYRCRHATGTIDDYVKCADNAGISVLGISDHIPFEDFEHHPDRMFFHELPDYINEIEEAQKKYPEMLILKGLEMDYRPILGKAYYQDTYFDKLGLDYMIGGAHYTPAREGRTSRWCSYIKPIPPELLREFVDLTIATMETGLVAYMAHPDLTAVACDRWKPEYKALYREIIDASLALDIPLEINAYGFRKPYVDTPEGSRPPYPWLPFWEMAAEANVKAVIGMDAHRPEDVSSNYAEVRAFADKLGIRLCEKEVVQKILQKKS